MLYFWHALENQARQLRALLTEQGWRALGYQLRDHMPKPAQKSFPREGHRLYASDDEVADVLAEAGFRPEAVRILGRTEAPAGRLLLARAYDVPSN